MSVFLWFLTIQMKILKNINKNKALRIFLKRLPADLQPVNSKKNL